MKQVLELEVQVLIKMVIQFLLATSAIGLSARWAVLVRRDTSLGRLQAEHVLLGFGSNFLDTLGISSFATTTTYLRARHLIMDELLPGTLNVGYTLPTIAQALIFIAIIKVDTLLLASCILAATAGAWLGVRIVTRLNVQLIRILMASALTMFAAISAIANLGYLPAGGVGLELSGAALVAAILFFFVMGALQTAGIGIYAPSLIFLSLLGLNPKAVFPVMMGAAALLMPVAALHFLKSACFSQRTAVGLAIGGVPAVLAAAFLVESMPLDVLRWLVIVVVMFTAASLLRAALSHRRIKLVGSVNTAE
jgi:uncharacterized membrane protein YfcA